jgi:hypothetical protein
MTLALGVKARHGSPCRANLFGCAVSSSSDGARDAMTRTVIAVILVWSVLALDGDHTLRDAGRADAQPRSVSVREHHNAPTRDGHFIDPALTHVHAGRLHRDPAFHASLRGPIYAQPLYWAADTESAVVGQVMPELNAARKD